MQFRTVFGAVELRSPRLYRCRCEQSAERTFSPLGELLGDHVAPELTYLEAKWASRVSFSAATALMCEVLPVAPTTNPESVRQHTYRVARRMESELGEEQAMFVDGCQGVLETTITTADGTTHVGDHDRLAFIGGSRQIGEPALPTLAIDIASRAGGCGYLFDASPWDSPAARDGYVVRRLGCDGVPQVLLALASAHYPERYTLP